MKNGKEASLIPDVHPDVASVAKVMSPTPHGVGPLPVAMLCHNTLGYFIVGLFCYICSFFLFVWLFFFTYALLAVVCVSHVEDRFFNTPRL
jgi:hypothetical protein